MPYWSGTVSCCTNLFGLNPLVLFPIAARRTLLCHCSGRRANVHATSMLAASSTGRSANVAPLHTWSTGESARHLTSGPLCVHMLTTRWRHRAFSFVTDVTNQFRINKYTMLSLAVGNIIHWGKPCIIIFSLVETKINIIGLSL